MTNREEGEDDSSSYPQHESARILHPSFAEAKIALKSRNNCRINEMNGSEFATCGENRESVTSSL